MNGVSPQPHTSSRCTRARPVSGDVDSAPALRGLARRAGARGPAGRPAQAARSPLHPIKPARTHPRQTGARLSRAPGPAGCRTRCGGCGRRRARAACGPSAASASHRAGCHVAGSARTDARERRGAWGRLLSFRAPGGRPTCRLKKADSGPAPLPPPPPLCSSAGAASSACGARAAALAGARSAARWRVRYLRCGCASVAVATLRQALRQALRIAMSACCSDRLSCPARNLSNTSKAGICASAHQRGHACTYRLLHEHALAL